MSTKQALREEARARVRRMTPADIEQAGIRIAQRVSGLPAMRAARSILLYASLPREVPTARIAADARLRGLEVVYPRCLVEDRAMSLHLVDHEDDLIADGRLGIREPAMSCPIRRLEEIDIAFIPGLAWNRHGHRLGRGAGYYDRLLGDPGWRGVRCGIFFAAQELPAVPTDEWDVPLDMVVTEEEVVEF